MRIIFFLQCCVLIHLSIGVVVMKNYEIQDLMSLTSEFTNEASQWIFPNENAASTSLICNNIPLLGGFNMITSSPFNMKRYYTVGSAHSQVWIEAQFYMMGTWISTDEIFITVDNGAGVITGGEVIRLLDHASDPWTQQTCTLGSTTTYPQMQLVTVYVEATHSTNQLNIQITGTITAYKVASFGVREIKITLLNSADPDFQCGITNPASQLAQDECPCPYGQALSPTLTCVNCDPSCEVCSAPGPTFCTICKPKYVYNGATCDPCSSLCATCNGVSPNQCLSCVPGYSLHVDGTCQVLSACTAPYLNKNYDNIAYCSLPCASNQYLYQDNSCRNTCVAPFIPSVITSPATYNVCNFPCFGQFLLFYGACTATCSPAPLQQSIDGAYKYCNCYPNYVYAGNVCLVGCSPPMSIVPYQGNLYCNQPCDDDNPYYDEDVGVCVQLCPYPSLVVQRVGYLACVLQIGAEDAEAVRNLNQISGIAGFATMCLVTALTAIFPGDPSAVVILSLAKIIQYIKFMFIFYPARLELLFKIYDPALEVLGVSLGMTDDMKKPFHMDPIPYKFEKYKVHSSFIVNFSITLVFLLGIFVIYLLFLGLEHHLQTRRNRRKQRKFLQASTVTSIRFHIQNFLLIQFYSNYGDIILFAALQIRKIDLHFGLAWADFLLFSTLILIGPFIFFRHYQILKEYQLLVYNKGIGFRSHYVALFQKLNEGTKVLFITFKDSAIFQQCYLLLFVARMALFSIMLAFLFDHPIVQSVMMMLLTLAMLIYIIAIRPYLKIINFIQLLLVELTIFTVNITLIILAVLDSKQDYVSKTKENIGNIILFCSVVFSFLPGVSAVLKIFDLIFDRLSPKSPASMQETASGYYYPWEQHLKKRSSGQRTSPFGRRGARGNTGNMGNTIGTDQNVTINDSYVGLNPSLTSESDILSRKKIARGGVQQRRGSPDSNNNTNNSRNSRDNTPPGTRFNTTTPPGTRIDTNTSPDGRNTLEEIPEIELMQTHGNQKTETIEALDVSDFNEYLERKGNEIPQEVPFRKHWSRRKEDAESKANRQRNQSPQQQADRIKIKKVRDLGGETLDKQDKEYLN